MVKAWAAASAYSLLKAYPIFCLPRGLYNFFPSSPHFFQIKASFSKYQLFLQIVYLIPLSLISFSVYL